MRFLDLKFLTLTQLDKAGVAVITNNEKYGQEKDALRNFRATAVLEQKTVPQAVVGMMSKDVVHMYDMITDDMAGYSIEDLEEKVTTIQGYLTLLKVAVIERETEKIHVTAPPLPITTNGTRKDANA